MFDFSLMKNDGSNETISVRCGEVTFFVGGNGTGKSSLVNSIYRRHANNNSVYVVAHRKNTFDNDIIDFSNSDYKNATQRIFNDSMSQTSRYRTHWENEKAALPIVKIKNKVTAHAVTNMKNLKNGGKLEEITLDSEIDLVNDIFKSSGFNLEFIIDEESNLMVNNLNY
ncbi:ATP-binding cassette domain-containing protein, partial [Serratia marcescens]|uniref:ATP-binding cassette domain-containing protein n=1 Tax=Serratia marcescens TaxID=615 RepID=UPI0011151D2F